jgi:hypothetical protein
VFIVKSNSHAALLPVDINDSNVTGIFEELEVRI